MPPPPSPRESLSLMPNSIAARRDICPSAPIRVVLALLASDRDRRRTNLNERITCRAIGLGCEAHLRTGGGGRGDGGGEMIRFEASARDNVFTSSTAASPKSGRNRGATLRRRIG
jgi:hypothetical protein